MIGSALRMPSRAGLFIGLTSLLLTSVVAQNIYYAFRGPDLAKERLAERKHYYEKVLSKADVTFREAQFYEVVPSRP